MMEAAPYHSDDLTFDEVELLLEEVKTRPEIPHQKIKAILDISGRDVFSPYYGYEYDIKRSTSLSQHTIFDGPKESTSLSRQIRLSNPIKGPNENLSIFLIELLDITYDMRDEVEGIDIFPRYANVPAPPKIRTDITSPGYYFEKDGIKVQSGYYTQLSSGVFCPHDDFSIIYLNNVGEGYRQILVTYVKAKYDMGILRELKFYYSHEDTEGENILYYQFTIVLNSYGYITEIYDNKDQIEIMGNISYFSSRDHNTGEIRNLVSILY